VETAEMKIHGMCQFALLEVYVMFPSEAHQQEQAAHHHNTLDSGVLQIAVL
jgi:hypothetical protein